MSLDHDDHADISIVDDVSMWLFESFENCKETVQGVVPGTTVEVYIRGKLVLDMGKAVVIPGAARLIVSAPQLRRSYHWHGAGSAHVYTHKTSGAQLVFRLDKVRFRDE